MKKLILVSILFLSLTSCSENYSNGERIGVITQFSKTGLIWKSYEGHLNVTQTGMNSSVPFDFSIDNDNEPEHVVKILDSAAQYGWKVKLIYHQTKFKNFAKNRGETNHFITAVEVLDKDMSHPFAVSSGGLDTTNRTHITGRVDTIYVVIDRSK